MFIVDQPIKVIHGKYKGKNGLVSETRICECGEQEVKIRVSIRFVLTDIGWIHSRFIQGINMSDSLERFPYKEMKQEIYVSHPIPPDPMPDYAKLIIKETPFDTLQRMNPTLYGLFLKCVEKIISKNHDYAGNEDFYRNFRKSEAVNIPAWKGIFVRFGDKVSRIEGFIKTGILKVQDESILDTVIDCANYILLMYACYLDSPENAKKIIK